MKTCQHAASGCNYPEGECNGACINIAKHTPGSLELIAYRESLRRFDWQFEFSDDAGVRFRALYNLAELRRMQTALDPDGSIWRAVAPGGHGEPQPKVSA
jgi:hypothetical protein